MINLWQAAPACQGVFQAGECHMQRNLASQEGRWRWVADCEAHSFYQFAFNFQIWAAQEVGSGLGCLGVTQNFPSFPSSDAAWCQLEMSQFNIWWLLHARCEQRHLDGDVPEGMLFPVHWVQPAEPSTAAGGLCSPLGFGCLSIPPLLGVQQCLNQGGMLDTAHVRAQLGRRLRSRRVSVQLTAVLRRWWYLSWCHNQDNKSGEAKGAWALIRVRSELGASH